MADYELNKRLGAGAFGEVWLANDRALATKRAVKFVDRSKIHDPTNFYSEPHALKTLEHPNIVKVEDAGQTRDGRLYIAMEYLPRGSVESVYQGAVIPTRASIQVACDVARALEYAHGKGFIHRDVKPANILLTSAGKAKLSDFGLATQVKGDGTASGYGYIAHIAPEVLQTGKASISSDIYALGVTVYRMVNGDASLPTGSRTEIEDLIKAGKFPERSNYQPFVTKKLRDVINKSMSVKPRDRFPTAQAFRNALEQVPVFCDWTSEVIRHGTIWRAAVGSMSYEATLANIAKKMWSFRLKKGQAGTLRNVTADARVAVDEKSARKQMANVLSRIVNTGK